MSIVAEVIGWFIVDAVGWCIGMATGRAFKLDPRRTQRLAQSAGFAIILVAGLTVTLLYS